MATTHNEVSAPPGASAADDMGQDPLAKLHKMSTTAGVASPQYVAISTAAVVASLLGVASALALLSPLLLIIPVAGVVVACVAWRHIADSNGTETGKGLAAAGLVLSLLLGGGIFGREVAERVHARNDARQMQAVADQLTQRLKARDYDAAYGMFTTPFRQRVTLDQFKVRWESMQQPGPLQSLTWNGVLPAYESVGQSVAGVISMAVSFTDREGRFTFVFRKTDDGGWQLENIPELFPMERPQRRQ